VEAFDFPAGLGVIRPGVFEDDAALGEFGCEGSSVTAEGGGEDGAVVAQDWGREAVVVGGFVEGGDDVGGGRDRNGAAGKAEAAVVVDDVEYFDTAPVLQRDVGDVHLPALIRERGFEADVGALGPFVRLGRDEPAPCEDPPDARDWTRSDPAVGLREVRVDRVGSGLNAELRELLSDRDDLIFDRFGDTCWWPVRPFGAGDQARFARGPVAGDQLVQPCLGDAVRPSDLTNAASLDQHRLHHERRQLHRTPPA